MRTYALRGVSELARNFLHQQIMVPAGDVVSNEVPCTIEGMGLGRVIPDPDRYVGMEGASRGGACRQQRVPHGQFQVVSVGGDRHQSLLLREWKKAQQPRGP